MNKEYKDSGLLFPFKEYALKSADAIVAEFKSSLTQGLSTQEVAAKLKQYGTNQSHERAITGLDILIHQVGSLFFMLFCSIALLFLVLGQWSDAIIVLLLISINLVLAFYQEYKASRTIKLLHSYIKKMAVVLRDGKKQSVAVACLVPGDIVYLKEGDIVPADLRIIQEKELVIDEAILTGEAAPVKKRTEITDHTVDLFNAFTIAFAGTIVEQGSGVGIVFATGNGSIFGSLIKSTGYRSWHESAIEKGVVQLSKIIVLLSVVTLIGVFAANIAIKGYANIDVMRLLMFCCALMVSIIPEALPIVVIFNLSLGVRRLIAMDVVVKRLSALEDLGAVQVLCIDKTGTLTEHQLAVAQLIASDVQSLLSYSCVSLLPQLTGQAGFEGAIENYIGANSSALITQIPAAYSYIESIPFEPVHRRVMVLVQKKDSGEYICAVRGSFENVAGMCSSGTDDFAKQAHQEGSKGNRVLAIAIKKLVSKPESLAAQDLGYTMIGLLSFTDPIKKSALQVLNTAKEMGISIKVISGDAPEVCGAIATALQLINDPTSVITGAMLDAASPADCVRLINDNSVFARILPDQKAAIIQAVKIDKTVGYMGDGLNDLPALESADVAIVVQGCPDVVREAGDIILQQNSLLAVVQGITQGRIVLANTMKYIKTVLSTNFGNFYTIAICSLFIPYVPLLPIQILLLNFMSDFPMITLGTDAPDAQDLSHPQRYNITSILSIAVILGIVSSIFDFMLFSYFMRRSETVLHTGWFLENVVTQMAFIFSIRTRNLFFKGSRPSGMLVGSAFVVVIFSFFLIYSSIGQRLFQFAPLDAASLLFILFILVTYFVTTEAVKWAYYQKFGAKS